MCMQQEITSVYVPVKTPDYKILAIILSILIHIGLIGFVIFHNNHQNKPVVMETVLITPEQLTAIQQQIQANQQGNGQANFADYRSLNSNNAHTKQASSSSRSEKTHQQSTSESQKISDDLAKRQSEWEAQRDAVAEQLDKEAMQSLQDVEQQVTEQRIEEVQRLKDLKHAESNADAVAEKIRQQHQDAQKQQRVENERKPANEDSERSVTIGNTNNSSEAGNAQSSREGANSGGNSASYQQAIISKIYQNWHPPENRGGKTLRANIRLSSSGDVTSITVSNSDDQAFIDSLENAIRASSPLPVPSDPAMFQKFANLTLTFKAKAE